MLPCILRAMSFGTGLNLGLEGVTPPRTLQEMTFDFELNQGFTIRLRVQPEFGGHVHRLRVHPEGVELLGNLLAMTFGDGLNLSLEGVELPRGLLAVTFDYEFNQSFGCL